MNEYFNRDLKRQYSWLPKGITSFILCTVATGRWSIISAILSNGEFLCLITDDTGNAYKFCDFLMYFSICDYFCKNKDNIRMKSYTW